MFATLNCLGKLKDELVFEDKHSKRKPMGDRDFDGEVRMQAK
jgi:hypothetical protein